MRLSCRAVGLKMVDMSVVVANPDDAESRMQRMMEWAKGPQPPVFLCVHVYSYSRCAFNCQESFLKKGEDGSSPQSCRMGSFVICRGSFTKAADFGAVVGTDDCLTRG
jgi:hypothetical protein